MAAPTGLCRGRSEWDLDQATDADTVRTAAAQCQRCPVLESCHDELRRRIATDDPPISAVQAGAIFGSDGSLLSGTALIRVMRRRRPDKPLPAAAARLLGATTR